MTHATVPPEYHPNAHGSQVKLASGLNFLAGLYLLISTWSNTVSGGSTVNGVVLGIIVAILAATRFAGASGPWASWLDALIGLWMIISPWVYGYGGEAWMWNAIVVGIIIFVLGAWSATASGMSGTSGTMHRTT